MRGSRGLWTSGLIVGFALAAPAAAQDDVKPVFLVTDVVVDDAVAVDKDAARDALANRFGRLRDKVEVRSLAEVKTTLDRAAMSQMLGSSGSDDEIAKIGDYVTVDRLVFGRIHMVAGVTEVQVKIFNTREGVSEIGLSRRLKAGAAPALVLTLLDSLADGLLAFVVDTYTDGAASAAFAGLKNKKLTPPRAQSAVGESPASTRAAGTLGMLAVVGGVVAGAGAGIAAVGGIGLGQDGNQAGDVPIILAASGAGAVLVGTTFIIIDGVTE